MSKYKQKNKSDLDQFFEEKNSYLEAVFNLIADFIENLRESDNDTIKKEETEKK